MERLAMSAVVVRTIDQRPAPGSMIKPGELIDVLDMALTLSDRRIYNLLIANAWDKIGDDTTHCVAKADLRWRGAWIGTSKFSGLESVKNAFGVRIGIVHTATNTI